MRKKLAAEVLEPAENCGFLEKSPMGLRENRRFKGGEKTQSVADYSIPPDINSKILGL
jgi:hypothetical protein|tara:strand:+ start:82 stop:255 length:174 start_codon:yes stop_codon:yes gene_type:complete